MRRQVLITMTLALVLAGCGAEQQAQDPPTSSESAAEAPESTPTEADDASGAQDDISEPPPPPDVPELLEFKAKTIEGETFRGRDLFGAPAVLWFWAPWCPTCQGEAPTIAEAAKTDGVRFVGVAAQDQVPAMQEFVDKYGLGTFPHLADTSAEIWKRFDVTYQPAYAFVHANGEIEVEKELLEPDELLNRVRALR